MDFVIDTVGDKEDALDDADVTKNKDKKAGKAQLSTIEELKKFRNQLLQNLTDVPKKAKTKRDVNNSLTEAVLDDLGWTNKSGAKSKKKKIQKAKIVIDEIKSAKTAAEIKKTLEKSVITPNFEQLHAVPAPIVSKRKLQKERREERAKTKGKKWFGMPATEITEEVKRDLEILQMRSILDPKHFYKKNDTKVLPKYFQVGKVMDSPLDFYNNRLTKKERKKTLVDELLADAEFQKYNKRKYKEIIEEKQKTHYKAWRQAKRLKKKK